MTKKRVENREGSLGYPGFVKPAVFTKDTGKYVEIIRILILLRPSRKPEEVPIAAKVMGPGPVDPCPTRGLLATDHVNLNHSQVTWTTPELATPLQTTTPHQREDVSALDRFSMHRCPTRWVFSDTGLELMTKPATIRYLYHSTTAATQWSRHGTASRPGLG
ncbi:uncharacterized protein TNCV_4023441 [Trichonephila clavipes]|nr:uncharacterized protein TNCV_4023441 [Trichonephila clavipes]